MVSTNSFVLLVDKEIWMEERNNISLGAVNIYIWWLVFK